MKRVTEVKLSTLKKHRASSSIRTLMEEDAYLISFGFVMLKGVLLIIQHHC